MSESSFRWYHGAMVMVALLGVVHAIPGAVAAQSAQPADDIGPTLPVFLDGQAQIIQEFQDTTDWIREHLWVEAEFDSDGDGRLDRMHVDVTRPGQTESEGLLVPVIYESSPYYSGTGTTAQEYFWDVRQELGTEPPERSDMPSVRYRGERSVIANSHVNQWVPRGFAVVHSEAPGTGQSEGCPTVGGPVEALAPKAVIDWLNGRARGFDAPVGGGEVVADWTTGKVGMTGTSYNGTIPLAAATTGVEGLEAIIPVAPNTSYYQYYRSHGLVRSPGGYLGEDMDVLYDFINSGSPEKRAYCNATFRDREMLEGQDRVTGDYNEFWAERDFHRSLDGVRAATLLAHGLNDWNVMPDHSVVVYEALKERGVPAQIYLHQGGHGGPPPMERMNRWFTHYLYGVDNGIEEDPRAWIVREGSQASQPTPYRDYPNPRARPVRFGLTQGGRGLGGLELAPVGGQGRESLVDNVSFGGDVLARADWSHHRLRYATPVLSAPVHISGTPRVTVRLAADRPAANLSVWLVTLPYSEDGGSTASIITRGWADPQNYASLSQSEPLEPGRFYDVTFELQPDDQIVPAGSRIALMIFSSDRDFTLWPDPGTELEVDLDGSMLELPVVGGEWWLRRALAPRR